MAKHRIEIFSRKIPDFLLNPEHKILRHFLAQAVILLITVNMLWDEPDAILTDRLIAWFLYFLQVNTVVYGNMYLLVPQLLIKGKMAYYFLSLLLLIIGAIMAFSLLQPPTDNPAMGNAENIPSLLGTISSLTAFCLFIFGLTAAQLLKYRLKNIRKIDALKNVTMAVELANLQNQINPHFLFNMLNNVNIVAGENADSAAHILRKLKTLLQYQVEEGAKEHVKLTDDIAFIGDYLALEKLRRDRFSYHVEVAGNTDVNVPPLLFIPFVENAVKHNPENDSYVNIIFRITNSRLYFECTNPKAKLPRTNRQGGIGLVNIKKRLELLFEKNYSLVLKNEEELYIVKMEIKINFQAKSRFRQRIAN